MAKSRQQADDFKPLIYSSRPIVTLKEWNGLTPSERISRFQAIDYVATSHPSASNSVETIDETDHTARSSVSSSSMVSAKQSVNKSPHQGIRVRIPTSKSSSMLSSCASSSRVSSRTFSAQRSDTASSRPSSKASWSEDKLFSAGWSLDDRAHSPQSFISFNNALSFSPSDLDSQSVRRKPVASPPIRRRWSMLRSSSSASFTQRHANQLHSFKNRPGTSDANHLHSFRPRPETSDGRIGATTIKRSFSRRLGSIKRALSSIQD